MDQIVIYTDGACSGNGGGNARGGWAAILVHPSKERKLSGAESNATNQRMELRAAIEALKALTAPCQVTLYSDSAYMVNCFWDRWYEAWRQNGWRNKKKQPVANRELWEELLELVEARPRRRLPEGCQSCEQAGSHLEQPRVVQPALRRVGGGGGDRPLVLSCERHVGEPAHNAPSSTSSTRGMHLFDLPPNRSDLVRGRVYAPHARRYRDANLRPALSR
jgi:ribonuclease HI